MSKVEIGEVYKLPDDEYLIADMDEGEAYEVDRTAIYQDGEKFLLATASGCSCWSGEWYATQYDTLDELMVDIGPKGEAEIPYHPTFEGVITLQKQVDAWKELHEDA